MIGGISAALGGVTASTARYEQAAARVSASSMEGGSDVAIAAGAAVTSDAMVQMAVARFSLLASLQAARTTNEMLAETLRLGRGA